MNEHLTVQTVLFSIFLGSIGIALADKYRLPGIIIYLSIGVLFGRNALGLIQPSSLGTGISVIITVFVSIILFEGGLSLNFRQLSALKIVLMKDIFFSVLIIISSGFLAARYILDLSWEVSLVFSSLIIVTGPTVIKPIIRHIPLKEKVKEFLNGEAVLIDAIGAVIAIIMLDFVISKQQVGQVILSFALSIGAGLLTGVIFGFLAYYLIMKTDFFPESTHSYLTLGIVFSDFWLSESIASESGLMSVMALGIVMSNIEYKIKENIIEYIEKTTRILISILFVLLSAGFDLRKVSEIFWEGMAAVFILIIARFPVIFLSTAKQGFTQGERLFISWIGPRGIIALAVASIIALKLKSHGFENSEAVEILVFLLIVSTVLIQGLSAKFLAGKLNLFEKGDKSIVILGINEITLFTAEELRNYTDILFVDSNKESCSKADQRGFQYRAGNAFDKSIYDGIDLENYSTVLACSENSEVNILYCRFLKNNFGFSSLFAVLNEKESEKLSEIIKNEGIKLAFGTSGLLNLSARYSYLKKLKEYLSSSKKIIYKIKIGSKEFLNNAPGKYPFPDGCLVLLIKRDEKDYYIYHNQMKLEMNDEVYYVSREEDSVLLEGIV